jgi:hypothetical protein
MFRRHSVFLPLTALFFSSFSLLEAQTVSTTPVGYRTDAIPAGNTAYAPSFVHADTYVGTITSLTESGANTIVDCADFSGNAAGSLDQGSLYPAYYLEITQSGDKEGYIFDIISNTTSGVTVSGLLSSGFSLAGTESVTIRKHMTVGDVFTSATSSLTAYSDSVKLFNGDGTISVLYWDGSQWTPDFANNHSTKPVYPGAGFLTSFASSVDLTVNGHVKTTKTKVPVYAGLVNLVGCMAPSDSDVDGFNGTASLQAYSDSVKVVSQDGNFSTQGTYYSDGSVMTRDFATNHGAESFTGHNAALFSVGSDSYITCNAGYESGED